MVSSAPLRKSYYWRGLGLVLWYEVWGEDAPCNLDRLHDVALYSTLTAGPLGLTTVVVAVAVT